MWFRTRFARLRNSRLHVLTESGRRVFFGRALLPYLRPPHLPATLRAFPSVRALSVPVGEGLTAKTPRGRGEEEGKKEGVGCRGREPVVLTFDL